MALTRDAIHEVVKPYLKKKYGRDYLPAKKAEAVLDIISETLPNVAAMLQDDVIPGTKKLIIWNNNPKSMRKIYEVSVR